MRGLRVELAFGERVHTETSCYTMYDDGSAKKVSDRELNLGSPCGVGLLGKGSPHGDQLLS